MFGVTLFEAEIVLVGSQVPHDFELIGEGLLGPFFAVFDLAANFFQFVIKANNAITCLLALEFLLVYLFPQFVNHDLGSLTAILVIKLFEECVNFT